MRHESLFFLFSPVTRIKGVGTTTGDAFRRLLPLATAEGGAPLVRDVLFHLPSGIVDRTFTCPLADAPDGVIATFIVTVTEHLPPPPIRRGGRRPYKVICGNDTGEITLVFFHAREDYIKGALPEGQKRVISGRVERSPQYELQMVHPDIIAPVDKLAEVQKPEPVYPLTVGLTSRRIARIVEDAIAKLPLLPEWIAPATIAQYKWPAWKDALEAAHHPQVIEDLSPESLPRMRLAYDEMLSNQLHLAILRRNMQQQAGERIDGSGKLKDKLLAALPFKLTAGQQQVLADIEADMGSGKRMGRLLQGDVGSGKTIVALLAMLRVAGQGLQSALMVPTEIIASQHFKTITTLLKGMGVEVGLLTGSVKGKPRQALLKAIAEGEAHIVIGTHALFQEKVEFKNLALVVIDEQHRFGVNQRMALTAKGNAPHLLHMTATPIPRSLEMTLYGDMESSLLKEKPVGRKPITTRLIPLSRYGDIMERLKAALDRGEKAYWICPLIEEKYTEGELELTPELDLAAAETRYKEFAARFGNRVGLVHGRMKADQRNEVMHRFAAGEFRLLVATTVVEVGVDVKDATIMVVEKAERFGLAQLHQLRGRVGRSDLPSACALLYTDRTGDGGKDRLGILRDSEDGFAIAEADLVQRGGGDILGVRQSGLPKFIFTDLFAHQKLLMEAREEVKQALKTDPDLATPQGQALQLLLQLFGHE